MKECEWCGRELVHREDETDYNYANRRTCNKQHAALATQSKAKKKRKRLERVPVVINLGAVALKR